eukprot:scaffold64853_cov65-Phaeocystis_antarctica.AAC.1
MKQVTFQWSSAFIVNTALHNHKARSKCYLPWRLHRTIKGTNDNKYMAATPSATRHTQKRAAAQTLKVSDVIYGGGGDATRHSCAEHDIICYV